MGILCPGITAFAAEWTRENIDSIPALLSFYA